MVRVSINELASELTPEEVIELEEASKRPILFDDDCPEMSEEMLRQFHPFDKIPVRISPTNMKKVRSFGNNINVMLERLLDAAINDPEIVKKCV